MHDWLTSFHLFLAYHSLEQITYSGILLNALAFDRCHFYLDFRPKSSYEMGFLYVDGCMDITPLLQRVQNYMSKWYTGNYQNQKADRKQKGSISSYSYDISLYIEYLEAEFIYTELYTLLMNLRLEKRCLKCIMPPEEGSIRQIQIRVLDIWFLKTINMYLPGCYTWMAIEHAKKRRASAWEMTRRF
jgi:hypothetical protein